MTEQTAPLARVLHVADYMAPFTDAARTDFASYAKSGETLRTSVKRLMVAALVTGDEADNGKAAKAASKAVIDTLGEDAKKGSVSVMRSKIKGALDVETVVRLRKEAAGWDLLEVQPFADLIHNLADALAVDWDAKAAKADADGDAPKGEGEGEGENGEAPAATFPSVDKAIETASAALDFIHASAQGELGGVAFTALQAMVADYTAKAAKLAKAHEKALAKAAAKARDAERRRIRRASTVAKAA